MVKRPKDVHNSSHKNRHPKGTHPPMFKCYGKKKGK